MTSSTKMNPAQLMGASFLSGAVAAYVYSRYLMRVQQESSSSSGSNRSRRSSSRAASSFDPVAELFNQNDIGLHVVNHLARVYAALGGTTLAGVAGVFLQQRTKFSTSIASLISLGLALSMQFSKSQLWKLLAFGLFNGMSLGGLVKLATLVNPAIVPMALGSTTMIFASFAAAATLSTRRSLLYLYGGLGSALSILSLTSFADLFLRSKTLFNFNLYGGLLMFMGYVMADSQLIIERADRGDDDYVTHAWLLFTDLSAMFTRIIIVLLKQSEEEEKKRRRSDRKGNRDGEFYD